jgi:hypothetical protein
MKIPSIVGFAVVILVAGIAYMADRGSAPSVAAAPPPPAKPALPAVKPLSDEEAKELIAKVKTTWRAQDGETVEAITTKVAKVAHFVPRGWDVAQGDDGSKSVVLSWARHQADKEGDEYPPGSWFDRVDPKEQEAFEAARKAFERARLGR